MQLSTQPWDPSKASAWAQYLGLVEVPLFAQQPTDRSGLPDTSSVLLDGRAASFCLHVVDGASSLDYDRLLSWSWSANLYHTITVNPGTRRLDLRRWDAPHRTGEQMRVPQHSIEAMDVFSRLRKAGPPRGSNVIQHVLRAFRMIREAMAPCAGLEAIRVFNLLLLLVGSETTDGEERGLLSCEHIADLWQLADDEQQALIGDMGLDRQMMRRNIELVIDRLVEPEPVTGLKLHPNLLIRHAAGQLYQEAHLVLERDPQMVFAGLAEPATPRGTPKRDARYTPPELARFLTQQVLNEVAHLDGPDKCVVLDPACGSGVFLLEALRELATRGVAAPIRLVGFDTSDIACHLARFCLREASAGDAFAPGQVSVDIRHDDALEQEWPEADAILMNPPFISWQNMDEAQRDATREVLGNTLTGRANLAMPFVLKASNSLSERGALGTVLPSALLETEAGQQWRQELAEQNDLTLIGRFEGYSYFPSSAVEPSFVVFAQATQRGTTDILIAKEGAESAGLRAFRLSQRHLDAPSGDRWEIGGVDRDDLVSSGSWLPRSLAYLRFAERLRDSDMPTVSDLFSVHQGARTGANDVFIIDSDEYDQLPKRERRLFRPIASNSTIRRGRIRRTEWVFFPYTERGPVLTTEEQVAGKMPTFYRERLEPERERLAERYGMSDENWWLLSVPRGWQRERRQKLVTTYFGMAGSFAYDDAGDTVVVQGHYWEWQGDAAREDSDEPAFYDTPLPWAYLAFLNSSVFEHFLTCFCPRQRGGQFNLSQRFVGQVPLPDLSDDLRAPSSVVTHLADLGRAIHAGEFPSNEVLSEAVAEIYGIGDALVSAGLL